MRRTVTPQPLPDTALAIAANLPRLRRFARALTGGQASGDRFAVATLEWMLVDDSAVRAHPDPRIALFAAFHRVWSSYCALRGSADWSRETIARICKTAPATDPDPREALLLQAVEGFRAEEVARIMRTDPAHVEHLIRRARAELRGH